MDALIPDCLNCGNPVDRPPVAETVNKRGTYSIETLWRTCACGAFSRSRRIVRTSDLYAHAEPA